MAVSGMHACDRHNQLSQIGVMEKNSGRAPKYLPEIIEEGVKDMLLRKRQTQ